MADAALKTRSVQVPIRASIHELEPGIQTRLGVVWICRTADEMAAITAPGYFDSTLSHGFKVNDRIEVTCVATSPSTFATLAIDVIRYPDNPGDPRVICRVLAMHGPD